MNSVFPTIRRGLYRMNVGYRRRELDHAALMHGNLSGGRINSAVEDNRFDQQASGCIVLLNGLY